MKLVTLENFQKLAGLSDRALCWLLVRNRLRCENDAQHGLMVDLDSLETRELLKSISAEQSSALESGQRLLIERLAGVATKGFEEIVNQACSLIQARGGK